MREVNGRFLFEAEALRTASVQTMLAKAGFNPDQPRDNQGCWTRWSCESETPLRLEHVQYQGDFHDLVVEFMVQNLKKSGAKAFKSIRIHGVNGRSAIADGGAILPGHKPFLIDAKTGESPRFTDEQMEVYALLCMGGHAVSFSPKIRELGFQPGELLPPMDTMIARTLGPGKAIQPESFCESYGFWPVGRHGP